MGIWSNITKSLGSFGKTVNKYSPEILIGCGIASFTGAVVMTAVNAPKAARAVDELHEDLAEIDEDLTKKQIFWKEFKTAAPYYVPTVALSSTGIACIMGSHHISTKRTAALATAYELSQASMKEYREKVIEKLGEKKEGDIRNEILQDKIDKNPPSDDICKEDLDKSYQCKENEVMLTDGKILWYDAMGGRYFRASQQEVDKAVKYVSDRLPLEMWMSLNELYFELGLPQTIAGDQLGFTVEYGIDLQDNNCVTAPNGVKASVMDFLVRPTPEFRSY